MKRVPHGKRVTHGALLMVSALLLVGSLCAEESTATMPVPALQPRVTAAGPATALNLDTTSIRGNQELPKVMYVVPWKDAAMAELAGRPVNSLVEEVLAPVDREVFRRQTRYFHQLYDAKAPAD